MGVLSYPDGFPTVPALDGWDNNETIAESIITEAMDLAEALQSGKSVIDVNAILDYYTIDGLKDLVYNALSTEVQQGGYGLDPQDETDLWNRARDRENINALMAYEEVKRNYSMSGFTLPTGALTKQLERASNTAVEKNSSINRELTIKEADLYWEGKKFVFSLSVTMEQLLLAIADAKGKIHAQLNAVTLETEARIIAAALSMLNMNASIGNHFSRSQSASASANESRAMSESYSLSDSFNYNYNHNYAAD